MYSDGKLDAPGIETHRNDSVPEDVMLVYSADDLPIFYSSDKDLGLAAFRMATPDVELQKRWLDIHTSVVVEGPDLKKLKSSLDDETKELIQPYFGFVEKTNEIMSTKNIRLVIKRIDDQMCPLFHVDNLKLRFLVTMKGKGTQWLRKEDTIHKNLGKGGKKPIAKPDVYLQELQEGQVAWLKGSGHPSSKGLVHRSPAVNPTLGETRLFFRADFF